jgi:hypothetical protein
MMKNLLDQDDDQPDPAPAKPKPATVGLGLFDDVDPPEGTDKEPYVLSETGDGSPDETMRRSGLAWSAGIAMFSSIVFMLALGWIADLLLGTSPWGIVGGIVLGALIGFVQLFRISSQIFQK